MLSKKLLAVLQHRILQAGPSVKLENLGEASSCGGDTVQHRNYRSCVSPNSMTATDIATCIVNLLFMATLAQCIDFNKPLLLSKVQHRLIRVVSALLEPALSQS